MKLNHLAIAILSVALVPSAAFAQAAPAPAPAPASATDAGLAAGKMVYDPQGGEVGKIESVNGANVVLDTGSNKATLPKSAFASGAKGLTINATKVQIDAAVADAIAKTNATLAAALVPGAEVQGKAGAIIGTIKEIDGDNVILERSAGPVSLNKNTFTAPNGKLMLTLTAAELDAAAQAATAEAGSSS